ncbi:unnamed protein product [Microthlaspi erraticum]|uniref:RRM domain-containing protein n=1 Tax=Microthlaspi erraticum TaxID=1685480 RepID=A0A6D2JX47_9BRAS|nr:unnamed protein product [Microthlaspi erraticum]
MASASASAGYICYVKGLGESSSHRSVEVAFDQFGDIVDIKLELDTKNPKTKIDMFHAFVTYKDEKSVDDAVEVMNGLDLDGWPMTVTKHDPRDGGAH